MAVAHPATARDGSPQSCVPSIDTRVRAGLGWPQPRHQHEAARLAQATWRGLRSRRAAAAHYLRPNVHRSPPPWDWLSVLLSELPAALACCLPPDHRQDILTRKGGDGKGLLGTGGGAGGRGCAASLAAAGSVVGSTGSDRSVGMTEVRSQLSVTGGTHVTGSSGAANFGGANLLDRYMDRRYTDGSTFGSTLGSTSPPSPRSSAGTPHELLAFEPSLLAAHWEPPHLSADHADGASLFPATPYHEWGAWEPGRVMDRAPDGVAAPAGARTSITAAFYMATTATSPSSYYELATYE